MRAIERAVVCALGTVLLVGVGSPGTELEFAL